MMPATPPDPPPTWRRLAADVPFVPSPCIGVCALDDTTSICIGCGRTLAEVAAWSRLTNAQRREVVTRLPARLETLARSRQGGGEHDAQR
jgi:predicted Fe-S protein YdhL (DUF1289 family)